MLAVQMMLTSVPVHSESATFLVDQLYFVKLGVLINTEESEEKHKWTDRALMMEYGRLDSIEVEEYGSGGWIQRIRARCFPSPFSILSPGMARISTTNGLSGEKRETRIRTEEPTS